MTQAQFSALGHFVRILHVPRNKKRFARFVLAYYLLAGETGPFATENSCCVYNVIIRFGFPRDDIKITSIIVNFRKLENQE